MTAIPFEERREAADNAADLRKVLASILFIAPYDSEPFTGPLTDAAGNVTDLPEGYQPVGRITEDGIEFTKDMSTEEVRSHGYMAPGRVDMTEVTRGISFSAQQVDQKFLRAIADNVDLSEVTADANGEVSYEVSDRPNIRYYRMLAIGKDGSYDSEYLRALSFPRVTVTSLPGETWNNDALALSFEFRVFEDPELGYTVMPFFGGAGFDAARLGYGTAGA